MDVTTTKDARLPPPSETPRWQELCFDVFGQPNPNLPWLWLDWLNDEGINRLVLYQMVPAAKIGSLAWDMIALGKPVRDKNGKHLTGALMTEQQWTLWERFQCWPSLYWIIQGTKGGHRRRYSPTESNLLKTRQAPTQPPSPGALPYAPFDNRVIDAVQANNLERLWKLGKSFAARTPDDLDSEEQQALADIEAKHVDYLEQQVRAAYEEYNSLLRPIEIPTSAETKPLDWDLAKQELITRGVNAHGTGEL